MIGSFFGLLLLLVLLALLWRRRRNADGAAGQANHGRRISDKYASGWSGPPGAGLGGGGADGAGSGPSGRGAYAALAGGGGAALGAGAAAAAAGRDRDSDTNSDEWEADGLTRGGGSGFFVVGGKKRDSSRAWNQRRASGASSIGRGTPRSARSSLRNIPPSASNEAQAGPSGSKGKGLLAGLFGGGGLLLGKALNRPHQSHPVATNEFDAGDASDEDAHDDTTNLPNVGPRSGIDEKRGLMGSGPFADPDHPDSGSDEGHQEMRQTGRGGWGGWGLAGLGAGSAAYAAAHRRGDSQATNESEDDDEHYEDPMSPIHGGPPSSVATAGRGDGDRPLSNLSSLGGMSHDHGAESSAVAPSAAAATAGARSRGSQSGSGSGDPSSGSKGDPFSDSGPSSGTGTSLPPPPRAPRDRSGSSPRIYGNVAPSGNAPDQPRIPSFYGGFGSGDLGLDNDSQRRDSDGTTQEGHGVEPALLGAGAAAGGLGALAAGHRDSGGSTYSKGKYHSGLPSESNNPSGDSLQSQRHSKFISAGTNLLGPGAAGRGSSRESLQNSDGSGGNGSSSGNGSSGQSQERLAEEQNQGQARRLPTIESVSEFGERPESSSPIAAGAAAAGAGQGSLGSSGDGSRGSRGGKSGVSYVTSPEHTRPSMNQQRASEEHDQPVRQSTDFDSGVDQLRPRSGETGGHTSGFTSPEPQDGGASESHHDASTAGAAAAGAGLFGGLSAGWRRLTMGMTPGPAPRSEEGSGVPRILEERRDSETLPSDQSPPLSQTRFGQQAERDPNLLSDVRSQHASVHGGLSASPSLAHHHSSREHSGDSGQPPTREPTRRSVQTHSSSEPSVSSAEHGAGYAASVSNSSSSGTRSSASRGGLRHQGTGRSAASSSTGVDSASWRAQGSSSGSSGVGRGYSSRSNHESEGSGGSTDAASYSPSNLNRQSTQSTRGGVSSISGRAAYAGARRASQNDGGSSFAEDGAGDEGGEDDYSEYYGDGQSSQATAGDGSTRRARSDLSNDSSSVASGSLAHPYAYGAADGGMRRLSSVREGPEDDALSQTPSRGLGEFDEDAFRHYPSATFGAAAMRQAQREAGSASPPQSGDMGSRENSSTTIRPAPAAAHGIPASLIPGLASPSVSLSGINTEQPQGETSGSSSSSWRQSPRVESIQRRAAAAAAAASGSGTADNSNSSTAGAPGGAVDLPVVAEEPGREEESEASAAQRQSGRRSAWNIFGGGGGS